MSVVLFPVLWLCGGVAVCMPLGGRMFAALVTKNGSHLPCFYIAFYFTLPITTGEACLWIVEALELSAQLI